MGKKRGYEKKLAYAMLAIFIALFCVFLLLILASYLNGGGPVLFSPGSGEPFSGSQYAKDIYIYENNPDGTGISYTDPQLYFGIVDLGGGNLKKFKSLIYFNISTIPQNNYILSAKLNITIKPQACSGRLNISKITNPWNQIYTSWNNRSNTLLWATPGGDYSSEIINSSTISSGGNYSLDITSLVKDWYLNPEQNYGLIIYPGDNSVCLVSVESTE